MVDFWMHPFPGAPIKRPSLSGLKSSLQQVHAQHMQKSSPLSFSGWKPAHEVLKDATETAAAPESEQQVLKEQRKSTSAFCMPWKSKTTAVSLSHIIINRDCLATVVFNDLFLVCFCTSDTSPQVRQGSTSSSFLESRSRVVFPRPLHCAPVSSDHGSIQNLYIISTPATLLPRSDLTYNFLKASRKITSKRQTHWLKCVMSFFKNWDIFLIASTFIIYIKHLKLQNYLFVFDVYWCFVYCNLTRNRIQHVETTQL